MGCGKEMPTHHLTMNTIDLGYVIPGAYSGLSRIRGCSSLCCTNKAMVGATSCSVGALETSAPPKSAPPKGNFLNKGGVGMAGCHTLLNEKRSPKSFDSEDLK